MPTIANVQLYALLEFASLVVMASFVWWKLRLSLLHQLAFVLETRFVNVQAKVLLWVLHTMLASVLHFGMHGMLEALYILPSRTERADQASGVHAYRCGLLLSVCVASHQQYIDRIGAWVLDL
jgi:hypothetical protein